MQTISASNSCIKTVEELQIELHSDLTRGLDSTEVPERKNKHGINELTTDEDEPIWKKFLEKFKEPMIALLLGSAFISLVTRQYDDAISITLVSINVEFLYF